MLLRPRPRTTCPPRPRKFCPPRPRTTCQVERLKKNDLEKGGERARAEAPPQPCPSDFKFDPELNALALERGLDPTTVEAKHRSYITEHKICARDWREYARRWILREYPPKKSASQSASSKPAPAPVPELDEDTLRALRLGRERYEFWYRECDKHHDNWICLLDRLDVTYAEAETQLGDDATRDAFEDRIKAELRRVAEHRATLAARTTVRESGVGGFTKPTQLTADEQSEGCRQMARGQANSDDEEVAAFIASWSCP